MQIIDELERDKRGIYGGCIGYFGADGAMDTCIVLRTSVIKDGTMHIQSGAGIVYDSIPESGEHRMHQQGRGPGAGRRGSDPLRDGRHARAIGVLGRQSKLHSTAA